MNLHQVCLLSFASLCFSGCALVSYNYSPECTTDDSNGINNKETVKLVETHIGEYIATHDSCTQKALKFKTTEDLLGYTVPFGTYVKVGSDDDGTEYYSDQNTNGVKIQLGFFTRPTLGFMVLPDSEELCVIDDRNIYRCEDFENLPQLDIIEMPIWGSNTSMYTYGGVENDHFVINEYKNSLGYPTQNIKHTYKISENEQEIEIDNVKLRVVKTESQYISYYATKNNQQPFW